MRLDARDSAPEQLGGAVHSDSAHLSQSATGTSAVVLLSSDPSHLPVLKTFSRLLCSIFEGRKFSSEEGTLSRDTIIESALPLPVGPLARSKLHDQISNKLLETNTLFF